MDYKSRDFFTYSVFFDTVLGNGGSQQKSLQIEQDSDFACVKLAYFAGEIDGDPGNTNGTRWVPQMTVQLQDTGSGRYLMNGPVALTDLFGTGELPFILPEDKILTARSTLFVIVSNYGTENVTNLYLSFSGMKLFI